MLDTMLEIRAPVPLLQMGIDREDVEQRVNEWLVLSLFTEDRISSGKAARMLDINRLDFLALLRKQGIAYIDYSEQELAEEFASVKRLPTLIST